MNAQDRKDAEKRRKAKEAKDARKRKSAKAKLERSLRGTTRHDGPHPRKAGRELGSKGRDALRGSRGRNFGGGR